LLNMSGTETSVHDLARSSVTGLPITQYPLVVINTRQNRVVVWRGWRDCRIATFRTYIMTAHKSATSP